MIVSLLIFHEHFCVTKYSVMLLLHPYRIYTLIFNALCDWTRVFTILAVVNEAGR